VSRAGVGPPRARYTAGVFDEVADVLISRERIAARVAELGRAISADLEALGDDGEVVLLPVLTGSIIFVADLMRELPLKLRLDVVTVSSYPGDATTSHGAQLVGRLPESLEGRHVLIVDDILDSGGTLRFLREALAQRRPRSLKFCVLLRKQREAAVSCPCDYVGFDIPDEFVVGYGLDYDHYYRNLPDIVTLRPRD